ncbi:MAG: sulfatase/phosphatase domain-containing protein, partial [Verrucomicrobiia bacterium]
LKGRKGSTFEGGMRQATVIRWPGKIPAGASNNELMTAMDLHPTFAKLAGAKIPSDRVIDGKDIWPVLTGKAKTPHKAFFYHRGNELQAVRSGNWKLHLKDGEPTALHNLKTDIGESENLLAENPKIERELMAHIRNFEKDLATNSRTAAFVDNPKALKR